MSDDTLQDASETHYRYLNKSDLRRLNNQAIDNNLNVQIEPDFVEQVEEKFPDGREVKYAIANRMLHNDKSGVVGFPF